MLFFPAIVSIIYHASVSGSPNPAFITIKTKDNNQIKSRGDLGYEKVD